MFVTTKEKLGPPATVPLGTETNPVLNPPLEAHGELKFTSVIPRCRLVGIYSLERRKERLTNYVVVSLEEAED